MSISINEGEKLVITNDLPSITIDDALTLNLIDTLIEPPLANIYAQENAVFLNDRWYIIPENSFAVIPYEFDMIGMLIPNVMKYQRRDDYCQGESQSLIKGQVGDLIEEYHVDPNKSKLKMIEAEDGWLVVPFEGIS